MPDNRTLLKELGGLFTDMTRQGLMSVDEIAADIVERYGEVEAVLPGLNDSFIVRWKDGTAHRVSVAEYPNG